MTRGRNVTFPPLYVIAYIITVTTSYNSSIETSLKVYSETTTMLNTCQYVNAWNDHTYMS